MKINKSSGQIAKTLLALAVIVLLAIVIAYIVIKRAEKPLPPPTPPSEEPKPVYQATLGDIKFIFLEAIDKGSTLFAKQARYPEWQTDVKTTERFIELTVGAQNVGKENTPERIWDIAEIIDSEERKFTPLTEDVQNWLPEENLCGAVLKPSFEPTPCKKIYEVAKISTGLKIRVFIYEKNYLDKIASEGLLDIQLMP